MIELLHIIANRKILNTVHLVISLHAPFAKSIVGRAFNYILVNFFLVPVCMQTNVVTQLKKKKNHHHPKFKILKTFLLATFILSTLVQISPPGRLWGDEGYHEAACYLLCPSTQPHHTKQNSFSRKDRSETDSRTNHHPCTFYPTFWKSSIWGIRGTNLLSLPSQVKEKFEFRYPIIK